MLLRNNTKINWNKHWGTQFCKGREYMKHKLMEKLIGEVKQSCSLEIDQEEVQQVTKVKYLGRMMTNDNQDFIAAQVNLERAKKRWNSLRRIATSKNANPRIMKEIYCATMIPILLYWSETWNITERIKQMLEVFHHKVSR